MADFYSGYVTPPSGGPGYRIHLVVNQGTQSIPNNTTQLSWAAYLEMAYSWGGFYAYNSSSGSFVINGTTVLSIPSSVPSSAWDVSLYLGGGTITVTHNSDGTKTVPISGSFNGGNSGYAPGYMGFSSSMTLTTIPRATTPTVSPTSGDTGATYAIGHTPATSSFVHDIAYSLDGGSTWTNIATNVAGTTTSTNWTPAHSLLPNATSVTAIIRLTTKQSSGGATIGSPQTVNLPLTVPASVKPTVSAVSFADAQTSSPNMPSLMGGAGRFVQGWSKLLPTVTAAGASGSTVTGRTVTIGAQSTQSGVAFASPVSQSGSVPYSAVAQDSRGRSSDPFTGNVAVTAYNFPNLPTPSVVRTSDAAGNVPAPTGTYLAVTPAASVSSLNFSGEKNLLEYRIRTKPVGGSYTTVQDWTTTGVSGTTWTAKRVLAGPYAASNEYIVEVSIRDLFGKNGFSTSSTVVTREIPVASESVAFDWDEGEGLGINKYRQAGYALDVDGNVRFDGTLEVSGNIEAGGVVSQTRGGVLRQVVDTGNAATDSAQGIVELATNAETQTGTDATRAVTPAGLASRTATETRTGILEIATQAETLAGTDDVRAVTPKKLKGWSDALLGARSCIPESVTLSSGGTATILDSGRVNFSGVTNLTLDNVLEAEDAAWRVEVSCAANSGGIYLQMQALTSYNMIGDVAYWNAGPTRIQYFPTTVFSYLRFYSGSNGDPIAGTVDILRRSNHGIYLSQSYGSFTGDRQVVRTYAEGSINRSIVLITTGAATGWIRVVRLA